MWVLYFKQIVSRTHETEWLATLNILKQARVAKSQAKDLFETAMSSYSVFDINKVCATVVLWIWITVTCSIYMQLSLDAHVAIYKYNASYFICGNKSVIQYINMAT